jgi:acetyltransferase-like isoleucine patch superfamily enzyme
MNTKIAQNISRDKDGSFYLRDDWYPNPLPVNLVVEDMVYLDSAYSFACFHSKIPDGFKIGYASGNYLHSHFYAGGKGKISVGRYVILETTHILANSAVSIGDNCMFSWGSVITDSWIGESEFPADVRREILRRIAFSETRFPEIPDPKPVIIEDNVWVGFDAVILPGVRLGHGCVVGCKTVISGDVPPYAVIVGNPPRIVKFLTPDDTGDAKIEAIRKYTAARYYDKI